MILLQLAFKSLKNRWRTSLLTILSIGLSTVLLLSIERIRVTSEESFMGTISQTDLIVGARSGPLNLLLYSVFNIGSATNNVSYQTYEHYQKHPTVEWTIPYSLGDGHRGFRVVGTNEDFFKNYHFRGDHQIRIKEGEIFSNLWDVVVGSSVARELNYKLGDAIVIAHGVTRGEGILKHDNKPFKISGIMAATGTPLDRAVYMTLEGMEALHMDWQQGAPPLPNQEIKPEALSRDKIKVGAITSFFLRTKSRIETLRLQREINNYNEEPLLAIIPGVVLGELWRGVGYFTTTLQIISFLVVIVGLSAMLISLLTSLNERRREMSILRALGANPKQIMGLLVFESVVLTILGIFVGLVFSITLIGLFGPVLESNFGIVIHALHFTVNEVKYFLIILFLGVFAGLWPAVRAARQALKDGLTIRL